MPPRARNIDDWHERLIIAARARHTSAVRNNNRIQNAWKAAVNLLERSRTKIYVPRTGQNAGNVVGIPNSIDNRVAQVLIKIVKGEEEILLPEHEGRIEHNITDEQVVCGRHYRDSAYSILASLYLEYQGPGVNPQPTFVVQKRAQRFTDHEVMYDVATRKHGAWKAKDDLRNKNLISEEKGTGQNGCNVYSLTLIGAKACFHIFNNMYHPSKGNYALIAPRHGRVDENGIFTPHGAGGNFGGHERGVNTPQTIPSGTLPIVNPTPIITPTTIVTIPIVTTTSNIVSL